MNALKLYGQFSVCDYVHIALKKVQCVDEFLKQAPDSYSWPLGLSVSAHSLGMPLPPAVGLQSTAVFLPCTLLSLHSSLILV